MIQPALIEDPNDPGTFLIQSFETVQTTGGGPGSPTSNQGLYATRLQWGAAGRKYFETGIDRGVLYVDGAAIPWNGLISVQESPSGGDSTPYYLDGIKYLNQASPEDFKGSIEAYMYPDEFSECDGTEMIAAGLYIGQQTRKSFGLAYRTRIGNDIDGLDHGFKLHIIYNALAVPAEKDYQSLSDDTEPSTFNWDFTTKPVKFQDDAFGVKYGSHLTIDSRTTYPWAMLAIEKALFGDDETAPGLPTPQELLQMFVDNALLKITDNGDGTWTAEGPDDIINMTSDTEFEITWDSAIPSDDGESFTISSL